VQAAVTIISVISPEISRFMVYKLMEYY